MLKTHSILFTIILLLLASTTSSILLAQEVSKSDVEDQKAYFREFIKKNGERIDSMLGPKGYAFTYMGYGMPTNSGRKADVTFSFDSLRGLIYSSNTISNSTDSLFNASIQDTSAGTVVKRKDTPEETKVWFQNLTAYMCATNKKRAHQLIWEFFMVRPKELEN